MNLNIGTEYLNRKEKTGLDRYSIELIVRLKQSEELRGLTTFSYDHPTIGLPHYTLSGSRKTNAIKSLLGFGLPIEANTKSIVHATTPLAIQTKGKLVVTVHDLAPIFYPEAYPKHMPYIFKSTLKYLKKRGAYFIANSNCTANDLREYLHLKEDEVTVTYLGIDRNQFSVNHKNGREALKKYKLPPQYFCFAGSLNKRKNLFYVLDAYKEYVSNSKNPIHLVLAGRYDWGGKEVKKYVKENIKNTNLVHFPGFIDDKDLSKFYNASEALLYPSLYEGFGFPPLEALLSGTRVIVSNGGSLPEIIGDLGVKVNIKDVNSLAQILTDIENGTNMIPKYALVEDWIHQFNWDNTYQSTIEIYKKLI